LTEEVFITTKMVEGNYANLYMRTAPWITAVWGGIILMSLGIVLLMYSVRTWKEGSKEEETKKEENKGNKRRKKIEKVVASEKNGDVDRRYEELLQIELDELKKN
ncbi:MAG: hypothetical protein GQ567_01500, partial [Methanosarcinales archaeon]|nr:hypothetical protein [Methanosarcinales archaeon]